MTQLPEVPRRDDLRVIAAPRVTRGMDLGQLVVEMVQRVADAVDADRGTLYLVDAANRSLSSIVAHLPELEGIRLAFGQGIAGKVAERGLSINVTDAAADPRHDASFDGKTGYNTRSILALPVRDSREHVIGVLQLLNAGDGSFAATHERQARELCAHIGQVLQATSLYADLKPQGTVEAERPGLAFRFNQIIGESAAMQRVYGLVEKAARTDATVLITGESGTGKELIARAVHVNGARGEGPLVKVDCTTLPEQLIENELFGHEKGAYTGADRASTGKVEAANGGTLFIDEIGELPLRLQGKLLRLIQDREFERVGGTQTLSSDIRIICATHRDLLGMVREGLFRGDLYYRIRVVPIEVPALRERGQEDLTRLVEYFVDRFARRHDRPIVRVTENALTRLHAHDFPGNVRELENTIESAVVLCDGGCIDAADLPLIESVQPRTASLGNPEVTMEQIELAHMRGVLAACGGNRSEAARRLGIGRNTLARRLGAAE